jgi:hypothetical protein
MAFFRGPNVVTNGLVLALDAANPRSYVSGSTTWNDLSGNNSSGSLINGPTFNSANGGSIGFTTAGTSYTNLGPILNYTSENFTFSYWVNFNSLTTNVGGQGPVVLYKGEVNTNGYYDQISRNGTSGTISFLTNQSGANQVSNTDAGTITVGVWYNLAYVRNGTSIRIYVNGIDRTTTAGTHINPTSNGNNFTLATYNTSVYGNFNLSNFLNYNRTLSASEVLQNYNALKSRFNLN